MSHFALLVLTKNPAVLTMTEAEIEEEVRPLLEPYDENLEVEEYVKSCYCVGNLADIESTARARAEYGSHDELMNKVDELLPHLKDKMYFELQPDEYDLYNSTYRTLAKPFEDAKAKYMNEHPLKDAPDPECPTCHGKGTATTTYNPDSKWDWFQVGGRWADVKSPNYLDDMANFAPFAILTPDGEWFERGNMGWFSIVSDEISHVEWEKTYRDLITKYPDHIGIVVDCHI